jgi:hypothetical protein
MPSRVFILILLFALGSPALAQGTRQTSQGAKRPQTTTGTGVRTGPVATQPSNHPFENPIGQGVPPAVSTTNPALNSNRTNR